MKRAGLQPYHQRDPLREHNNNNGRGKLHEMFTYKERSTFDFTVSIANPPDICHPKSCLSKQKESARVLHINHFLNCEFLRFIAYIDDDLCRQLYRLGSNSLCLC